ncbi:MAG: YceH family protein [Desulfobacteraceae bacterium]|jgi:uncharacterized protein
MELQLDAMEIRILGSLIEKQLSTPDYYPLSLNALTNACNQKSSRDPVVAYDEGDVEAVLERMIEKQVVWKSHVGRVTKYEERFTHSRSLVPRESAVLCVLFLRGPQTLGEIRSRTSRLFEFEDLTQVQEALDNLVEWGLVRRLPRMPGHKESRCIHLLSKEAEDAQEPAASETEPVPAVDRSRIENIERALEGLRDEIDALKAEFAEFKKQFD